MGSETPESGAITPREAHLNRIYKEAEATSAKEKEEEKTRKLWERAEYISHLKETLDQLRTIGNDPDHADLEADLTAEYWRTTNDFMDRKWVNDPRVPQYPDLPESDNKELESTVAALVDLPPQWEIGLANSDPQENLDDRQEFFGFLSTPGGPEIYFVVDLYKEEVQIEGVPVELKNISTILTALSDLPDINEPPNQRINSIYCATDGTVLIKTIRSGRSSIHYKGNRQGYGVYVGKPGSMIALHEETQKPRRLEDGNVLEASGYIVSNLNIDPPTLNGQTLDRA